MKRWLRYSIYIILGLILLTWGYYSSLSSVFLENPISQTIGGDRIELQFSGPVHDRNATDKLHFVPDLEGDWQWESRSRAVFTITQKEKPEEVWLQFRDGWRDIWYRPFKTPQARQFFFVPELPQIAQIIPKEGMTLRGKMPLTIYWKEALPLLETTQADEIQSSIQIIPDIVGDWKILGAKGLIFIPEEAWLGSNQYEIRFGKELTGEAFTLEYQTETLKVLEVVADKLHGKEPLEIHFNQPFVMEDMWWIKLEPRMEFDMEYGFRSPPKDKSVLVVGRDPQKLLLTPRSRWQRNTEYTLSLPSMIRSKLGPLPPAETFETSFRTLQPLEVSYLRFPQHIDQPFEIVFSHAIPSEAFWDHIRLSLGGQEIKLSGGAEENHTAHRFWIEPPEGVWDPESSYQLTLEGEIEDVYGQKLGERKQWDFQPEVASYLSWSDPEKPTEQLLLHGEKPLLNLDYGGDLAQLLVEVRRTYPSPQEARHFFTLQSDRFKAPGQKEIDLESAFPQFLSKDKRLLGGVYEVHIQGLRSGGEPAPVGELETTMYVSDFPVLAERFSHGWYLDTFESLPEDEPLEVWIFEDEEQKKYSDSGLPFYASGHPQRAFIRQGDRLGVILLGGTPTKSSLREWFWITDKTYYRGGEEMAFEGWIADLSLREKTYPFSGAQGDYYRIDLVAEGASPQTLARGEINKGHFKGSASLDPQAQGQYELVLSVNDQRLGSQIIVVGQDPPVDMIPEDVPYRSHLTLLNHKKVYEKEEKMVILGSLTSSEGKGLKKENILVELWEGELLQKTEKIEADRRGFFRFPLIVADQEGHYQLRFKTIEKEGWIEREVVDFMVVGDRGLAWESEDWALVLDKEVYRSDDTAQLFLGRPSEAELKTLKAHVVRDDRLLPLKFDEQGRSYLKIEDWMEPSVQISLWIQAEQAGERVIKHVQVPINVKSPARDLLIKPQLEKTDYQAGDTLRLNFETHLGGAPTSAEVSLYVQYQDQPFTTPRIVFPFDKTLLALQDPSLAGGTNQSLSKAAQTHLVKHLQTDDLGRGMVEFVVPPGSSHLRIWMMGSHQGEAFTATHTDIEIPVPLTIEASAPSFLRVGDATTIDFDLSRVEMVDDILKLDLILRAPSGVEIDYPDQSVRIWKDKNLSFGIKTTRDFWHEVFEHQEGVYHLTFQLSVTSPTGLRAAKMFHIPLYPPLDLVRHDQGFTADDPTLAFPQSQPWKEKVDFELTSQAETAFEIKAWKPEGYSPTTYQTGTIPGGETIQGSFIPEREPESRGLKFVAQDNPYQFQTAWHQYFWAENMEGFQDRIWIERDYFAEDDTKFLEPIEDLQEGKTYLARVRFSIPQDYPKLILQDFWPSGTELGAFKIPAVEPGCVAWCGFLVTEHIQDKDHVHLEIENVAVGTYQFTYFFTATRSGDYEVFPPLVIDPSSQNPLGYDRGLRLLIREE